jgi:hypothetical protein
MSSFPPPPPSPPGGGFNAPPPPTGGAPIQNNLVIAIIGTVLGFFCCCFGVIPGAIGIYFATQVSKLAAAGDLAGAESKAKTAKILGIVGIALGATGIVLNIISAITGNWNFPTG